MMATVNVHVTTCITQQITLYLLDQYYLRLLRQKTELFGNFCVIMTVKSNKYIIKYSKTIQFRSRPPDCEKNPLILA